MQIANILLGAIALLGHLATAHPQPTQLELPYSIHNVSVSDPSIQYKNTSTSRPIRVFYREGGDPTKPTILLLHGYPSSSHEYRNLIPLLSDKYHVIAPDYPGFGFTEQPSDLVYTFDNLANVVQAWLAQLHVSSFIVYVMDYGAPIGFRLALRNPASIKAVVSQNGNAYVEGFGPAFAVLRDLYNDPTNPQYQITARAFNTPVGVVAQYVAGVPPTDVLKIEPESYVLDSALLERPGNADIQIGLFINYKTNEESYPAWQAYLREHQPPLLAVWGKGDEAFIPPGAEAFKRDVPNAEVHLLDGGHFLVETKVTEIAQFMLEFLARKGL